MEKNMKENLLSNLFSKQVKTKKKKVIKMNRICVLFLFLVFCRNCGESAIDSRCYCNDVIMNELSTLCTTHVFSISFDFSAQQNPLYDFVDFIFGLAAKEKSNSLVSHSNAVCPHVDIVTSVSPRHNNKRFCRRRFDFILNIFEIRFRIDQTG